ncbi:MAG TPA: polyhydroxyalkanoate synthesis regulator DNA-binding domain-containing protein [Myxococcota bacterium]|nr:polyhydroxyalkanoate synthesis regulator DNA-binding domain-containing protein [Myxococcota bacterium]HOS62370.1 polyhydroxyalkanoate synthesis regulator DNA-binding domain-containing protein [Myxococcota bacterium]HPL25413.1 polyhydroxyalkanoate synthesis regulator DNA-binding domain-containing protein [Myxococcota bacterium]
MRTIKRYPNRKLYDMTDSRYITLNEIADLVRDGVEIRVIDSKTSEDITKITLAQVLLAEEKGNRPVAPIQRLLTLLHSGGEYIHKRLAPVAALREEAEKTIQKLIKVEPPEELKDFVSHTVKAYEDVQHRADEQLQFFVSTVKSITNAQKEIEILYKKVEELTQRIEALEKSQKKPKRGQ